MQQKVERNPKNIYFFNVIFCSYMIFFPVPSTFYARYGKQPGQSQGLLNQLRCHSLIKQLCPLFPPRLYGAITPHF